MKKLKKYTIIGIIFVIAAGFIWHFVYDWSGNSYVLGFFFPVNESTWEHMKLLFFPMLIYAVFMNRKFKAAYPCITSALLFGILAGTAIIPVLFYTYSGILGKSYPVLDISTFLVSTVFVFVLVYRLTLSCRLQSREFLLKILVVFTAVCFVVFTYYPPGIGLFTSPVT